jgi:hypothetical protein
MREYATAIGASCQSLINAQTGQVESIQNHMSDYATYRALTRHQVAQPNLMSYSAHEVALLPSLLIHTESNEF